jgi:uncharacterized protein
MSPGRLSLAGTFDFFYADCPNFQQAATLRGMPVKPQNSILVATLGLVAVLWFLGQLSDWLTHSTMLSTFALLGLGGIVLTAWRRSPAAPPRRPQPATSLTAIQQTLTETEQVLLQLQSEADSSAALGPWTDQISSVRAALTRQTAQLTLLGGKSVGKTTLLHLLTQAWSPESHGIKTLVEGPSLFTGAATPSAAIAKQGQAADLVLFLVQADLTQPEYQALQELVAQGQRTLVVFNKQDQYLPAERSLLLQQIQHRLQGLVAASDIVAIAAQPKPIQVRRHQGDGTIQESLETPSPQIEALTRHLEQVLAQETPQLILQTTLHQALDLKAAVIAQLNQARRDRALPILERYQWLAASTAFASPLPALDIVATAAISSKMITELAALYQQPLNLDQAKPIATELAKLMLQLGVVEFSTQTLGSLLKGHSLTFVAGGVLQGVSAAYLTRLVGLSLIEYLQAQPQGQTTSLWQLDQIAQRLQQVFQQNQRLAFLQSFVQDTLGRLRETTGLGSHPASISLNSTETAPSVSVSFDSSAAAS